ncbi:class I SAM-dependent methyltransferase [Ureaplasma sp. ES3154-GEN]|uniref:class I SAM-dependent methyltransferase n=1 Tax=Ureaplasma sp. ES3154-GEN TaxID=2984844 RepID=UPI0021E8A43C|nr:class I SAM-dependent methyltransferase [Ureaplasma sp. ES3154-GEN]MCV3743685.1 class I SAM-dependent methyltransferase [Ureaplasma sp. ES3154-GEN]
MSHAKTNNSFANPTNDQEGYNLVIDMNEHHKPVGDWAFKNLEVKNNDVCLEIGCGGGINIKRLAGLTSFVTGIDISAMSINVSTEINIDEIAQKRVELFQASIEDFNAPNAKYSLATAFSTIYFWRDRQKAFSNIFRLLKNQGRFNIIFSSIKKQIEWQNILTFDLVSEFDLIKELNQAGFNQIKMIVEPQQQWIIIESVKI